MYARHVSLQLKPNRANELTQTLDQQIIPLLRKQPGFQGEITFLTTDGRQLFAISLWDRKEDADNYNRTTYPQIQKTLTNFIEGSPLVQNTEVTNSTVHNITVSGVGARAASS